MSSQKDNTPQLEDGFMRLAISIAEHFQSLYLTPNEWKIVWVVLRKTYGWQKKEDRISLSQFQKATGINRSNAHKCIKSLVAKSLLVAKPTTGGIIYSFNKHHSQWTGCYTNHSRNDNLLVAKPTTPLVAKPTTKLVAKPTNTIDKKDTITKDRGNTYVKYISIEVSLLIDLFKTVNPSYKRLFSNTTERACAERLINQYGIEKLKNLMSKLPDIIKKPYAPSITTPFELEVKMGKLIAFMQQEKGKVNKFSVKKL